MSSSPVVGPSLLLRNLHCSLPTLASRIYGPALSFPAAVSTAADGEAALDFFCGELGMGAAALRRWRGGLAQSAGRRWLSAAKRAEVPDADASFMRSAVADLRAIVSPFITIAQGPRGSRFVATRCIPPGMFLLGVPAAAVIFAQPPPARDPVTAFFMHVEEIIGQLVAADEIAADEDDAPPSHAGYVQYLKRSVVPCNNLPFMDRDEVLRCLRNSEPTAATREETGKSHTDSDEGPTSSSPALQLWEYFHEDMKGMPLSVYLRERLTREEYAWWVSLVLSRRAGAATLIPVVDKLNHNPEPNCYYTMATEESFCGIDVFDNLLAGVPSELLYEPYVHTFSIAEIPKGEELSLCYASPAGNGGEGLSVKSAEGRTAWQLQWGFVPERDSPYEARDLQEVAAIVAERRVDLRKEQFPPNQ